MNRRGRTGGRGCVATATENVVNTRSNLAVGVLIASFCVFFFFKITLVSSSPWFDSLSALATNVEYYSSVSFLASFSMYGMVLVALLFAFFFVRGGTGDLYLPGLCEALLAAWITIRFLGLLPSGNAKMEDLVFFAVSLVLILVSSQILLDCYSRLSRLTAKVIIAIASLCAIAAIIQWFIIVGPGDYLIFRQYRLTGFMFDAILTGLLYSLALICLVSIKRSKMISAPLFFGCAGLLVIGGILTGSRSFFYFLALAVAYYVFLYRNLKAAAVAGMLMLVAAIFLPDFISGASIYSMTGDELRDEKAELAWQLFLQHPLFGSGTDTFPAFDLSMGSGRGTNPHNIYLQVLCENGLVGFVPLALWVFALLYRLVRFGNLDDYFVTALAIVFLFASGIIGTLGEYWTMGFWILLSRLSDLTFSEAKRGRRRSCRQSGDSGFSHKRDERDMRCKTLHGTASRMTKIR